MNTPRSGISWRSHDIDRVVHAAIIHVAGAVAGAVADVDAAYGAYAAAENNTFNNTNNGNNNANYANDYDRKQGIVKKYCEKPCLADPV